MFHGDPFIQWKLNSPGGILAAPLLSGGELGAKSRKFQKTTPMENCRLSLLARQVLNFGTYAGLC
jgi:hypothetical protein